jgi:hypothetical protein
MSGILTGVVPVAAGIDIIIGLKFLRASQQ